MSREILLEIVTLRTPQARIIFFVLATFVVLIVPFAWLENLSLWKRLGFDWVPSIGLTRAYWHIIHLAPRAAWQQNPLIYLVLCVWLVIMALDIRTLVHSKAPTSANSV